MFTCVAYADVPYRLAVQIDRWIAAQISTRIMECICNSSRVAVFLPEDLILIYGSLEFCPLLESTLSVVLSSSLIHLVQRNIFISYFWIKISSMTNDSKLSVLLCPLLQSVL